MKKWNYGRCYAWFICMCCVADLGAASFKRFNLAEEVVPEDVMPCLSKKPLPEKPALDGYEDVRRSYAVLDCVGADQSCEDKVNAGYHVAKYIAKVFGFGASKVGHGLSILSEAQKEKYFGRKIAGAMSQNKQKLFGPSKEKDVTIVYKETFTGKEHQFCFSQKDQLDHVLQVYSPDKVEVKCQLTTCDFVYQCILQGVYQDSTVPSKYGTVSFESAHMESMLAALSSHLGVIKDGRAGRCEEAADLWNYKNLWVSDGKKKRVWKQVDRSVGPASLFTAPEFPNNCVRVMVGTLVLEGTFVETGAVPQLPAADSMCSVMWADFCKENATKKEGR